MKELLQTIIINLNIPNLNTLYKTNRFNRIYKSTKGKEFSEYVKNNFQRNEILKQKLYIKISFKIKRDCDIDAKLKVLLDSMNNVIYTDDSQIYKLKVEKIIVKKTDDVNTKIDIYDFD